MTGSDFDLNAVLAQGRKREEREGRGKKEEGREKSLRELCNSHYPRPRRVWTCVADLLCLKSFLDDPVDLVDPLPNSRTLDFERVSHTFACFFPNSPNPQACPYMRDIAFIFQDMRRPLPVGATKL